MNNYKYKVEYSSAFKKSLKKVLKQGKNIDKLLDIVDKLAKNEKLDLKYKNHSLANGRLYENCKECHIEPDWLLVYRYLDNNLILLLVATGSHSDLFKK